MRNLLLVCFLGLTLSLYMTRSHTETDPNISTEEQYEWDKHQQECDTKCHEAAAATINQDKLCENLDQDQCERSKKLYDTIITSVCDGECHELIEAGISSFASCAAEKCEARDRNCGENICHDAIKEAMQAREKELDERLINSFAKHE